MAEVPGTGAAPVAGAPGAAQPAAVSKPRLQHQDTSAYWDSEAWDPDSRVYVGGEIDGVHRLAVQPEKDNTAAPAPESPAVATAVSKPLKHQDSVAYWDSDAWDPDSRVYVGGEIDGVHRLAVQPEKDNTASPAAVPAPDSPAVATAVSKLRLQSQDSSDYWDSGAWAPAATAAVAGAAPVVNSQPESVPQRAPACMPLSPGVAATSPSGSSSLNRADSSYWDNSDWGAAPPMAAGAAARPFKKKMTSPKLNRANSDAYWAAEQWDPDERVYVGAGAGLTNHLTALLEKGSENLTRVWVGGLVSSSLKVAGELGSTVNLSEATGSSPALKDLYEVESEPIGAGAFATVRPATHLESGTKCVAKILSKSKAGDKYQQCVNGGLYRCLLKMTQETPHDGVVRFLDFLEGPEHYYTVMERLHGAELLKAVEDNFPLLESTCKRIMSQVFSALAHLHDKVGLIHRDVKLENFRFRDNSLDSTLVLFDFGMACRVDEEWDQQVCGTRMFMAPEVVGEAAERPHLAAMDVWAAGVILHVLLTGDSPVEQEEMEVLGRRDDASRALVDRAVQNCSELASSPREAVDLLRRLLVLEPGARATAAQALEHPWLSPDAAAAAA